MARCSRATSILLLSCLSVCVLPIGAARAGVVGDIVQDTHNFNSTIFFVSPLGQTFTAQSSSYARVAIMVTDVNANSGGPQLTLTLYDGSGFSGTVLRTQTVPAPVGAPAVR